MNINWKETIRDATVKQLIIAFGVSRDLPIVEIIKIASCTRVYFYKVKRKLFFDQLVLIFKMLPYDKDTKEYKGLNTALMEIARLFYSIGEKI